MATSKANILKRLQHWMDSKHGQMLLNYAYSWGASIVILGALFKLTHIAGADIMLFIGMGTEVIVFFLSGFERPYDVNKKDKKEEVAEENPQQLAGGTVIVGNGVPAGSTVVIGGSPLQNSANANEVSQNATSDVDASQLAGAIATSSAVASAQFQTMCPEMQEATKNYVDQLNELTDLLKQVAEQSARLTRDSEEMENMNRTLTGINKFYEMQLRSVSVQSATVDDVNAQTKKLAEQLEELNSVYARMVEALKVNMNK